MEESQQNPAIKPEDPALPANGVPAPEQPVTSSEPKNKKMMLIAIIAVVVLLAGGGAAYYLMSSKKEEAKQPAALAKVKVGVLLPFSGGASGSGFGELKGVQLAKKQLGADNVELVQADSKCDKDEAAKAIKELIDQKVVAIIGEACSGASLGALPLANENKVPMISPSASSPELSIANDYFFRVVPPDEFQGKFTAQLLYKKGLKKVSVLHTDESYGNALNDVFTQEFERLGGTVASEGKFVSDAIDLQTQADAVKTANPDAIYLVANSSPSAIAALKLVRGTGVTAPFYGADAINDNAILSEAQAAGEGLVVTAFSSGTKAFKQALTNEYPSEEFLYAAAEGYDAFAAVFQALKTGATSGEQVKTALQKVDFKGVSGRIKFNANGELTEAEHTYDIMQAKDGTFIPADAE